MQFQGPDAFFLAGTSGRPSENGQVQSSTFSIATQLFDRDNRPSMGGAKSKALKTVFVIWILSEIRRPPFLDAQFVSDLRTVWMGKPPVKILVQNF